MNLYASLHPDEHDYDHDSEFSDEDIITDDVEEKAMYKDVSD